jgi:hypothetical protein
MYPRIADEMSPQEATTKTTMADAIPKLSSSSNTLWEKNIRRFLEPWPEALKMDVTRQRWCGII